MSQHRPNTDRYWAARKERAASAWTSTGKPMASLILKGPKKAYASPAVLITARADYLAAANAEVIASTTSGMPAARQNVFGAPLQRLSLAEWSSPPTGCYAMRVRASAGTGRRLPFTCCQ